MPTRSKKGALVRAAFALAVSIAFIPALLAQEARGSLAETQDAQRLEQLQRVLDGKAAYATAIVGRWEDAARSAGRWDKAYATDLHAALMKLSPENLLVAGEASSYDAMMLAVATGRPVQAAGEGTVPTLGETNADLVYTPVSPCRLVDTRLAGGAIGGGGTRSFDVDGATFVGQGGFDGSCGVPFGVARAAALTLTVAGPSGPGFLTAWAAFTPQPFASFLNYTAGQVIANTTVVPVNPGAGSDISIFAGGSATNVIVDVVGYFAAPVATALDCITVASAEALVPPNAWTPVDANCPAGRTATGGGYDTPEGTLGYPGVWLTTLPNGNGWRTWVDNQTGGNRRISTFARCCRIPGR